MNKLCKVIDESQVVDLQKNIEKRLKEFEHFEVYTMKLKHFLSHIRKVLVGKNGNCSCLPAFLFMSLQVSLI